ncbi:YheV family putative metal-binding protein [Microbulbifer sp. OS29]|uniref:YheV family putative metal-binding protein n=1 Tax=Microbulbifer okhotskensis TaxID=2926617 RepID=A0A9X2EK20_9GAMM|nr:YheV family putative zinc ribbon protein [Microbulbifer okhotskensis]MCO1333055.1 YheV family putative metal-binding protein [Microbulbifer okhotskensis]
MMKKESSPQPGKAVKKRFIAGAVCPRCSEMDKIINYLMDGKNYRECVSCGFKDEIRLQSGPAELSTRLTKDKEVHEQTVALIQPTSNRKK